MDLASDEDDFLPSSFNVVSGPSAGVLDLNPDGTFTYVPAANFIGTDTFTYQAFDGALYSNVGTVTIRVFDQAPVATADSYNVAENGSLDGSEPAVLRNDYDPDGDAVVAVAVTQPSHASQFSLAPDGTFTYAPAAGFTGADSFTYEDYDGTLYSSPVTVTLNVTAVPVASADYYYLPAAGSLSVGAASGVLANDFDGTAAPLQAVLVQDASSGTLILNPDGSFAYTPGSPGQPVTFTYEAQAGPGGPVSAPVTVTLEPSGGQPTVSVQQVTFLNGHTLIPDSGAAPPIHATWQSGGSPVGDSVSYAAGDVVELMVVLNVSDPGQFQGPVQVVGTGGGLEFTGTAELNAAGRLVATDVTAQLPDEIQQFLPLQITWQVFPSGGQTVADWVVAGTSSNAFYEGADDPAPGNNFRETVEALGTKGAAGAKTDDDKINGIWNLFKAPAGGAPPQVKRKDGTVLTYYGSWTVSIDIAAKNDATAPAQTTASLIKYGDGDCVSWTRLFLDVLASQGIKQKDNFYVINSKTAGEFLYVQNWAVTPAGNKGSNTDAATKAMYPYVNTFPITGAYSVDPKTPAGAAVKQYVWKWTTNDITKNAGIAGQGNPNPLAAFINHVVAQVTVGGVTQFFDPSYGTTYASVNAFETSSVAFLGLGLPTPTAGGDVQVVYRAQTGTDLQRQPGLPTQYP
jgi:hypothetical protein